MKMMFHINDFKCSLCTNWFCPPFNLPYLLPCTHSICTTCLQKSTQNNLIICPQDLQQCNINSISLNVNIKRTLQRLMKQNKNYNENNQLESIKNLTITFNQIIFEKQKKLRNLEILINQIFNSEIQKLKQIHNKIKMDINRPFKIIQDWKDIVSSNFKNIHKNHQNGNHQAKSKNINLLNHYIEQGKKMKMEINSFFNLNFDLFADRLMRNPTICFEKDFTISQETLQKILQKKYNQNKQNIFNKQNLNTHQNENLNIKQKQKSNTNISIFQSLKQCNHSKPLTSLYINSIPQSKLYTHLGKHTKINQQNNIDHHHPTIKQIENLQKFISTDESNKSTKIAKNFTQKKSSKNNQNNNQTHFPFTSHKNTQLSLSQYHFQSINNQNYNNHEFKQPTENSQKQINYYFEIENENEKTSKLTQSLQNPTPNQTNIQSLKNSLQSRNHQTNNPSPNNSLLVSPKTIKQQQNQQNPYHQEQQLLNQDQDNPWNITNINFLKQWKFKSQIPKEQPLEIRQNTYYYNCQKQKLSYIKKMQIHKVQQTIKMTQIRQNIIQLINQSLHDIDMNIYLSSFNWINNNIQIVKFVKTSLNDNQLNILLNYLIKSNVKVLVLSGNNLTDISLNAFLNFVNMNNTLKTVYLSKNYINILKTKNKINTLKNQGINIYI